MRAAPKSAASFSNTASLLLFVMVSMNCAAFMRGVAAGSEDDEEPVVPLSAIFSISSIGVMPQIGSFANGKLKAIAPTSLPSMKTGEPDMPAKTLVRSTCAPDKRAMMTDCRGAGKPGSTPRTSTPNSCGSLPEKTVRATPFCPGFTSSSG